MAHWRAGPQGKSGGVIHATCPDLVTARTPALLAGRGHADARDRCPAIAAHGSTGRWRKTPYPARERRAYTAARGRGVARIRIPCGSVPGTGREPARPRAAGA